MGVYLQLQPPLQQLQPVQLQQVQLQPLQQLQLQPLQLQQLPQLQQMQCQVRNRMNLGLTLLIGVCHASHTSSESKITKHHLQQ
jgi:hypothetical protein